MENRTRIKGGNPAGLTLKTSIGQPANDGAFSRGGSSILPGVSVCSRKGTAQLSLAPFSIRFLSTNLTSHAA